jgi:hypothetical protein
MCPRRRCPRTPAHAALLTLGAALAAGCAAPNPAYWIGDAAADSNTAVPPGNDALPPLPPPDGVAETLPVSDVASTAADASYRDGPSTGDASPRDGPSTGDAPARDGRGGLDLRADGAAAATDTSGKTDVSPASDSGWYATRRITVGYDTQTNTYGRNDVSAGHTDACPSNQALIGYHGSVGAAPSGALLVFSLLGQCGKFTVNGGAPYTVALSPGGLLFDSGGDGSTSFDLICPANQVVVGFAGRSGEALDQLQMECAPLLIAQDAMMTLSIGPRMLLEPPKGGGGGSTFAESCPGGSIATGHEINEGAWIDALALRCGVPHLGP